MKGDKANPRRASGPGAGALSVRRASIGLSARSAAEEVFDNPAANDPDCADAHRAAAGDVLPPAGPQMARRRVDTEV
jgi:hypothetical protein